MNTYNQTFVSPEMMEELKKQGLVGGYREVPGEMESTARQALGSKAIAPMSAHDLKRARYLEDRKKIEGANRRLHEKLEEARNSEIVKLQQR